MDLISVKVEDLYIKCGQKVCRTKFIGKTPVAGAGWAKAPHFSPEVDKKKDSKSMCVFKPMVYKNHDKNRKNINDYNGYVLDTSVWFQLDFDEWSNENDINYLKDELKIMYFRSWSNKYHFVFTDKKLLELKKNNKWKAKKDFKTKNETDKNIEKTGELLYGQYSYCPKDAMMYNVRSDFKINDFNMLDTNIIYLKEKGKWINYNDNKQKDDNIMNIPVPPPKEKKVEKVMKSDNIEIQQCRINNKSTKKSKTSDLDINDDSLIEFGKCLNTKKWLDKGSYNNWTLIVWSLRDFPNAGKEISKLGNCYDEQKFNEKLSEWKPQEKPIDVGSFLHYCKNDNERLFKKLYHKYLIKPSFIGIKSEFHVADIVMKFKGNLWIYQSDDLDLENKKKLYFWIDKRKQWIVDVGKEKTTIFVQNTCNDWIDLQMSEFIQKMNGFEHLPNEEKLKNKDYLKLKSKYDSLNDISDKCNDLIFINKVVTVLIGKLSSRCDCVAFDAKPHLFAFRNTVYNLETHQFSDNKKEWYLLQNTNYDYINPSPDKIVKNDMGKDVTEVEYRKEQIDFLNVLFMFSFWGSTTVEITDDKGEITETEFYEIENKNLVVSFYRNCLYGKCPEKLVVFTGSGGNSKSMVDDVCKDTLNTSKNGYGGSGNVDDLTKSLSSGGHASLSKIDKKRAFFFCEPTNKELIAGTVKELTNGGKTQIRALYSNDTDKVLNCALAIECNNMPYFDAVKENEHSMIRRIIMSRWLSNFKVDKASQIEPLLRIFMRDCNLKHRLEKYNCAFFDFIVNYDEPIIKLKKQLKDKIIKEDDLKYHIDISHPLYKRDGLFTLPKICSNQIYVPKYCEEQAKNWVADSDKYYVFLKDYIEPIPNYVHLPKITKSMKITDLLDTYSPDVTNNKQGGIKTENLLEKFTSSKNYKHLSFDQRRQINKDKFNTYLSESLRYGKYMITKKFNCKTYEGKDTSARNILFGFRIIDETDTERECYCGGDSDKDEPSNKDEPSKQI